MSKKEIEQAKNKEKQYLIKFIITLSILIIVILCFIPFEIFILTIIFSFIAGFLIVLPFHFFTSWQNAKYYTKELKRITGVNDNDI